jgi:hypothetical protein
VHPKTAEHHDAGQGRLSVYHTILLGIKLRLFAPQVSNIIIKKKYPNLQKTIDKRPIS